MRPIKHRYYIESTDPLIGFVSNKGTPMVIPSRFTNFRRKRQQTSATMVTKDGVIVNLKRVDLDE